MFCRLVNVRRVLGKMRQVSGVSPRQRTRQTKSAKSTPITGHLWAKALREKACSDRRSTRCFHYERVHFASSLENSAPTSKLHFHVWVMSLIPSSYLLMAMANLIWRHSLINLLSGKRCDCHHCMYTCVCVNVCVRARARARYLRICMQLLEMYCSKTQFS